MRATEAALLTSAADAVALAVAALHPAAIAMAAQRRPLLALLQLPALLALLLG